MSYYNMAETQQRLANVRQILRDKHLDAALVYFDELNVANGWYLTGWCGQFEKGAVLVPVEGEPILLGGPESEPFAKAESAITKVRCFPVFMVPEEEYPNATIIDFAQLNAELKAEGTELKRIGLVGTTTIPHQVYLDFSAGFEGVELVDITDDDRMSRVSTLGYAWGYIGSCIPFVVSLVVVLFNKQIGISMTLAMMIAFLLNAIWWLCCALPLLFAYKQKHSMPRGKSPFLDSFKRLARIFSEMRTQPAIFIFLLAFFFYIDGVYTIIEMATVYGADMGIDSNGLLGALLVTQIVAFPCSIIFGRLSAKYDTNKQA